jgi:hypothetical protein
MSSLVAGFVAESRLAPTTPPDIGYMTDRAQKVAQAEPAAAVPGSRHVKNTDSGHEIHKDQPQLVIDSIRDVADAVRAGRTHLAPLMLRRWDHGLRDTRAAGIPAPKRPSFRRLRLPDRAGLALAPLLLLFLSVPMLLPAHGQVAPVPVDAPEVCRIGMNIEDLYELDMAGDTFGAVLWIWSLSPSAKLALEVIAFPTASSSLNLSPIEVVELSSGGQYGSRRVQVTFRYNWVMERYPFPQSARRDPDRRDQVRRCAPPLRARSARVVRVT